MEIQVSTYEDHTKSSFLKELDDDLERFKNDGISSLLYM